MATATGERQKNVKHLVGREEGENDQGIEFCQLQAAPWSRRREPQSPECVSWTSSLAAHFLRSQNLRRLVTFTDSKSLSLPRLSVSASVPPKPDANPEVSSGTPKDYEKAALVLLTRGDFNFWYATVRHNFPLAKYRATAILER